MTEYFKRGFGFQWHITNKCDQRCQHCYIYQVDRGDGWGKELDLDGCAAVLDNIQSFCLKMQCSPGITITGGYPLLCEHVWELLTLIHERGIPVSILGNPFHLNAEVCQQLRDLGCRSYQMSLDGLETTHDLLRKPGSYRATLKAIQLLKRAGIKSNIMSTVSLANYKELPELTRVIVDHKADLAAFARYAPTQGDIELIIPPIEYRKFLGRMWRAYSELAEKGTTFPFKDHLWTLFLHENGLIDINPQEEMIVDGCNCAVKHMTILPDGIVYACRRFKSPIGNALTESLENIFLCAQMEEYRDFNRMEGCKKCELRSYCRGCPAVAFGATGNFYAKDPQCWK